MLIFYKIEKMLSLRITFPLNAFHKKSKKTPAIEIMKAMKLKEKYFRLKLN
jgi:hypothetical protein